MLKRLKKKRVGLKWGAFLTCSLVKRTLSDIGRSRMPYSQAESDENDFAVSLRAMESKFGRRTVAG